MAWTTPKTWTDTTLTASELNEQVRDNEVWLKAALLLHGISSDSTLGQLKGALYGAKAYRSTDQATATGVTESITFNATDEFDSDALHDTSTNAARITIPAGAGGYYLLAGEAKFASNATGYREVLIEENGIDGGGTEVPGSLVRVAALSGSVTAIAVCTVHQLAAGDYVALTVTQTSGGALNVAQAALACVRLFVG